LDQKEGQNRLTPVELRAIDRIVMIACGTSWHAALVGEYLFEELAHLPVEVEYASEFRYRNAPIDKHTLVLAITQSGETADTLAGLREARRRGHKVLAICNVVGSTIAREADGGIYLHAEGYPAAEMKHGPIALIDEQTPTVFLVPKGALREKTYSNLQEIKARRGPIIAIATEGDEMAAKLANEAIYLPATLEPVLPLLEIVPLQLLAYHIAVRRGCDVDKPRNLAKSVTVE